MRRLGVILGSLFIADGLIALLGGREAVKWVDKRVGSRLPCSWERTLKKMESVDRRILTAWGVNNVMAGTAMILSALPREEVETAEA